MFITTYKVTAPQVIEEFVDTLEYDNKSVLVHVDYLAICKADIRYYLGNRDINVLNHKYPLAPIHEAVGHVIKDPTNTFKKNDKVILIPNFVDKNKCKGCTNLRCSNSDLGENYCPHAIFKSSNADGFMKPFYSCDPSLLVKYDDSIDPSIAVFSELLSVSNASCRRIDFSKAKNIALFGDGIMSYMMYILLTKKYHKHITVFGLNDDKLKSFKDADVAKFDSYLGEEFDTLIECVGGRGSEIAINQMINLSQIGADLILMGVSENNVCINTRKILEKGICLKGVTRSTNLDFIEVSKLLNDKSVQDDLKPLVLSTGKISSVNDVYKFYEMEINNTKIIGKNIMKF
ncbi:MAG TPA: hypothetical protein DHU62_06410 [Firmicutes bacterium]|nr:hypothetical protein [Bacillota bacterium]